MNEKFQLLFDKFSQLELKVDRILETQNELTRCRSITEAKIDEAGGSGPGASNYAGTAHPGSMEAQLNASLTQVNQLKSILSHRESSFSHLLQFS